MHLLCFYCMCLNHSAVRVQPGHTTTLQCFTPNDGHYKTFWLKLQNSSAPVLVALAESDKTDIIVEEPFQDASKYRLRCNQLSFNLSVLNTEQTDIALYYCGIIIYDRMYFGNGTLLMSEEHFNGRHWSCTQQYFMHLTCEKKYFANSLSFMILLLSDIAFYIVTYYNMKWLALFIGTEIIKEMEDRCGRSTLIFIRRYLRFQ